MLQYSSLSKIMEAETIGKNGTSSKSRRSRGNFFRKTNIIAVAIIAGMLPGCRSTNVSYTSEFVNFEKELAQSLSSEKEVVKLIGFRTLSVGDSEKQTIRNLVSEHGEELKKTNTVFSDDFSFYRIYFPMHTAIVEYNGKTYTANEKGVVSIPNLKDIRKITIIGRKKSESVQGTGSNRIEEDRILLKQALKQEVVNGVRTGYSIDGNICVFDCGAWTDMD